MMVNSAEDWFLFYLGYLLPQCAEGLKSPFYGQPLKWPSPPYLFSKFPAFDNTFLLDQPSEMMI